MNINLSEKEMAFLKKYAEVYENGRKDDCATTPIFVVEFPKDVPVGTDHSYEAIIYTWDMESYEGDDEIEEELRENGFSIEERDEIFAELDKYGEALNGSIQKAYVNTLWIPVAYFLTIDEAEHYCRNQQYLRISVKYVGYGANEDLTCLVGLLLKMGNQLTNSFGITDISTV